MGKNNKRKKPLAKTLDRHDLYEEAVQSSEEGLSFINRIFKNFRKRPVRTMREDFCGTALFVADFVKRNKENRAWGVDIDPEVLAWGEENHLSRLRNGARERLELICEDVITAKTPPVDTVIAYNFSYFIFKDRARLLEYFKTTYNALNDKGILYLDVFGGTGAIQRNKEKRTIDGFKRKDGQKIASFTYIWEHEKFNAINHDILCHIHFKFKDGSKINKAFTYDWRLWSLPEVQELLAEAGYKESHVYLHGWDKDGESDDIFRRRTWYDNEEGWVAYVVGIK